MRKLLLILTAVFLLPFAISLAAAADKGDIFTRIVKSGTIRCGYIVWPPFTVVDVNTGALSGVMVDYMNEVARNLSLKIEWAEEIQYGQQAAALESGRIDMICSGDGPFDAGAARYLDYSKPLIFTPVYAYVRSDDPRNDVSAYNTPDSTVAVMDGDLSTFITPDVFPLAKRDELPQSAQPSQLLMEVVTRKADTVITDSVTVATFDESHPGALRVINPDSPLRIVPGVFTLQKGDGRLLRFINEGIMAVQYARKDGAIVRRYDPDEKMSLWLPPLPYRADLALAARGDE